MGQRVQRGEAKWAEIVCAQESSGLSARSYCLQETIPLGLFYKWRGRLQNAAGRPAANENQEHGGFIDMGKLTSTGRIKSSGGVGPLEVTLDFGDGLTVTVRRG